jgi:molybdopterin-guanine dinucleotide biosynthesis protein
MTDNTQPYTNAGISLFEFMLNLRQNPRCLAKYFPKDLTPEVLKGEPRNLSRELKGTPKEMTDFVIVYGFGESELTHIVAVSFMAGKVDMTRPPSWAADHTHLTEVYGLTPIVLALAADDSFLPN